MNNKLYPGCYIRLTDRAVVSATKNGEGLYWDTEYQVLHISQSAHKETTVTFVGMRGQFFLKDLEGNFEILN